MEGLLKPRSPENSTESDGESPIKKPVVTMSYPLSLPQESIKLRLADNLSCIEIQDPNKRFEFKNEILEIGFSSPVDADVNAIKNKIAEHHKISNVNKLMLF